LETQTSAAVPTRARLSGRACAEASRAADAIIAGTETLMRDFPPNRSFATEAIFEGLETLFGMKTKRSKYEGPLTDGVRDSQLAKAFPKSQRSKPPLTIVRGPKR
jgi:hypothetical protein